MIHPDQIIAVYTMASERNGTLYTGVTTNLSRRIHEHEERARKGRPKRYGCTRLVWWKPFELITAAIQRERTIKNWKNLCDRLNG